jgi:ATP-dependent exoDNAse (exonuclease V) alpha subunit
MKILGFAFYGLRHLDSATSPPSLEFCPLRALGNGLLLKVHGSATRNMVCKLRARTLRAVAPTTAEGIEKYLGSGMVKGVGPVFARRLIERFGAEVLTVIEQNPGDLQRVEGIGPKRRQRIASAWEASKRVREIMLFLHSHGVSTSRAVRIYKTYGEQAVERVRRNPYILAKDTVHKAQGSEFSAVVIPLATQQYMLLQRNLIYTGITRGKKLVVLIGQRQALRIAVSNNKTQRRYSGLRDALTAESGFSVSLGAS